MITPTLPWGGRQNRSKEAWQSLLRGLEWSKRAAVSPGTVLTTVEVGHAPTHTVTNPNPASPQVGVLTLPLSALQDFLKLRDPGGTGGAEDHRQQADG